MWDFNLSQAMSAMFKTLPFLLFRIAIYLAIALSYLVFTSAGAGIGYLFSHGAGAFWGGALGLGLVSGVLYWVREYLLYLVKAGHIAVMVEVMQDRPLPDGKGQIDYAQGIVRQYFSEASMLFMLDQLIKGILHAVTRSMSMVASWIPIPGLDNLVGLFNKILEMSLTYVDEIIIAYIFKSKSSNPWQTCRDGLVLYVQNYKTMLKNAVFLTLLMYLLTFVIFFLVFAPVLVIARHIPGPAMFWACAMALVLAISLKAAILEPLSIFALTQVFLKVIEGQTPNREWSEKLDGMSNKFRDLSDRAANYVRPNPGPVRS